MGLSVGSCWPAQLARQQDELISLTGFVSNQVCKVTAVTVVICIAFYFALTNKCSDVFHNDCKDMLSCYFCTSTYNNLWRCVNLIVYLTGCQASRGLVILYLICQRGESFKSMFVWDALPMPRGYLSNFLFCHLPQYISFLFGVRFTL